MRKRAMFAHRLARFVWLLQTFTLKTAGEQTMDELISNAADTPEIFAMPQPNDAEGSQVVRVELDIVFTARQWRRIHRLQEPLEGHHSRRHRRKALHGIDHRWPGGVIPYEFDRNALFSSRDLAEIQKGMDEWEKYTCLRFVRAQRHHRNKIRFANGGGCFSNVGMVGGPQIVGLSPGCRYKSVVVHELGHAVGFLHEQTRPDRDHYVSILTRNIPPQFRYNFQKYPWQHVDLHRLQYDYRSVMHYGARAFSLNGKPTIRTKVAHYQEIIGKAKGLSFLDINLANLVYKCHARCRPHQKCPPEGFLDKHCQCMCPGDPVQECASSGRQTGSGTGSTTETGSETSTGVSGGGAGEGSQCRDQYGQCGEWARRGECRHAKNRVYMQAYCRHSCSLCGHGPKEQDCRDKGQHCPFWKEEGHCTHMFVDFMRDQCPKTCGFCPLVKHSPGAGDSETEYHSVTSASDVQDNVNASAPTTQAMTLQVVVCGFFLRLGATAVTLPIVV